MPTQKEISRGKKLLKYWKDQTGQSVNIITDHWGMSDLASIMTDKEVKALVDYFVKIDNGKDIKWFYNNYDDLEESAQQAKKDLERRRQLMQDTKERMDNWKAKR